MHFLTRQSFTASGFQVLKMDLTHEQLKQIEDLASIGRSIRSIARIMEFDYKAFKEAAEQEGSLLAYHFALGSERAQAALDLAIKNAAEGGNITAAQQFDKILKTQRYEERKRQLLGR